MEPRSFNERSLICRRLENISLEITGFDSQHRQIILFIRQGYEKIGATSTNGLTDQSYGYGSIIIRRIAAQLKFHFNWEQTANLLSLLLAQLYLIIYSILFPGSGSLKPHWAAKIETS